MDLDALLDAAAAAAEATGLHWEVRAEDTARTTISMQQGIVAEVRKVAVRGVGARLVAEGCPGYRFTNDLTPEAVRRTVAQAAEVARAHARAAGARPAPAQVQAQRIRWRTAARRWPPDAPLEEKAALLHRAHQSAAARLGKPGTIVCRWGESSGVRAVRTADGVDARCEPLLTTLQVLVTLRDGGSVRGDKEGFGGAAGLEHYAGHWEPEAIGQRAAARALDAARASQAPAGRMRALVDPVLGGILAHESFGHLTEGDVAASGYSLLKGRIGETLGSEHATVLDAGTLGIAGMGVDVPFDDQGVAARDVTILERGVFRSYLHSRETAGAEGVAPTGNARAIDIRHPPLCRMRNTSFAAGDLREEEALEALGDGIYACESLGGMPRSDGTFLFHALRGWRVQKGELAEPLKGVSLSGNILTLLRNVEGATRERHFDAWFFGGCGKFDQNGLEVSFGGPQVLVGEVTVGGEATGAGASPASGGGEPS